jgi:methionyl-tRNA formyltransferase
MRLAVMGTPAFTLPVLNRLYDAGHDIVAVYTQPPRSRGRGQNIRKTAVHRRADELGIPVRHPDSLKNQSVQDDFTALKLDAAVVAAYGLILPKPILSAPRLGCLNIHASLLPRWRGAAPIQHAILAGDDETGVTIMMMDEGLDTGPILMMESVKITPDTTGQSLHDQLAELGADLMADTLSKLDKGDICPRPQPDTGATYANKIQKSDGAINWTNTADEIDRQVRALATYPGTWCHMKGQRIKIYGVEFPPNPVERPENAHPGQVIDHELTIACGHSAGDGLIRPVKLQRPGKSIVDRADFLNGFDLGPGDLVHNG